MGALEVLERVRELDRLWQLKKDERTRLWAIATDISAKPADGMPYSGGGTGTGKLEVAVEKLISLEDELAKVISEANSLCDYIMPFLGRLPEKERLALYRYYLLGMTWERVAESMCYSTVHMWRIQKRGIEMLDAMINGTEKEKEKHG